MILLTRKDKEQSPFYLNHHLIESILPKKDTIVALKDGKQIMVQEEPSTIILRIIDFESNISLQTLKKKEEAEL